MQKQQLVIGGFLFSIGAKSQIDKISRVSQGSYEKMALISSDRTYKSKKPLEEMTISCVWASENNADNLSRLRAMKDKAQQLSDGLGNNLGRWVVKRIQAENTHIVSDGRSQVTNLTITLLEEKNAGV